MANEFASTQNSGGLLKNVYDGGESLSEALKRKREALMATKGMLDLDKQSSESDRES